jgi:cell division protein FtsL
MTGLLIISAIVLAITLVIITHHKRFLESYRQELLQTLQESRVVKSDLENLLNQAVQLSSQIVSKLEYQALETNRCDHLELPGDNCESSAHDAVDTGSDPGNKQADQISEQPDEISLELPLLHHQVVAMHKQGYSIKDIASKLNRGQGEVSLILSITNKRRVV